LGVPGGRAHAARFVKFALIGALATALQYAVLVLLVRAAGLYPTAASSIGFAASALANYLLNYRFTFRSDRPHASAAARFAALAAAGLLINAGIMHGLLQLRVQYLLAQVCATAVVLAWNFLGNSFWTFGVRPAEEHTQI
jgi:putative flippase GtrA